MRVLIVAVTGLLLSAAPASGAVRWASTTGSASAGSCPEAAPCSLAHAVNDAPDGSEVVVLPGSYSVSTELKLDTGASIHGVAGQARPVINSSSATNALFIYAGTDVAVRDLEIAGGKTALGLNSDGAIVERVVLHATGSGAQGLSEGLYAGNAVVRDVIATADGANAVAFLFGGMPSEARNLTGWATGAGAIGLAARTYRFSAGMGICAGQGSGNVNVSSSILHGDGSDLQILLDADCGTGSPMLRIGYSAFTTKQETDATIDTSPGHNQPLDAPATFVAPGTDLHERPGAPTIDAGLVDADTGTADVDGLPRQVGTIDMGASEFFRTPLVATPGTAGPTFNGSVDPGVLGTTFAFEFGPTDAYGSATDPVTLAPGAAQAVSAAPPGLDPAQTDHYRLRAVQGNVNYARTSYSGDAVYTGVPAASPTPSPGPTASPSPAPTVKKTVRCKVPKLKGLTKRKARKRLTKAHCRLGKVRGVKGGKVVKQGRKAGKRLKRRTKVPIRLG